MSLSTMCFTMVSALSNGEVRNLFVFVFVCASVHLCVCVRFFCHRIERCGIDVGRSLVLQKMAEFTKMFYCFASGMTRGMTVELTFVM